MEHWFSYLLQQSGSKKLFTKKEKTCILNTFTECFLYVLALTQTRLSHMELTSKIHSFFHIVFYVIQDN